MKKKLLSPKISSKKFNYTGNINLVFINETL
jgi:hypothetical protein